MTKSLHSVLRNLVTIFFFPVDFASMHFVPLISVDGPGVE